MSVAGFGTIVDLNTLTRKLAFVKQCLAKGDVSVAKTVMTTIGTNYTTVNNTIQAATVVPDLADVPQLSVFLPFLPSA